MLRSHEIVQLTTMFNRKRETRNQVCIREISTKLSSHNRIKNIINIEDNLHFKKQINEKNEASDHANATFKMSENKIEVDRISSMSIAKKFKE